MVRVVNGAEVHGCVCRKCNRARLDARMQRLSEPVAAVFPRVRSPRGRPGARPVYQTPADPPSIPPQWMSRCGFVSEVAADDVVELHYPRDPESVFRFALWAGRIPAIPYAIHLNRSGTGVLLELAPYCHLGALVDEDVRRRASVEVDNPQFSRWARGFSKSQLASYPLDILTAAEDVRRIGGPTAALTYLYARRPPFSCGVNRPSRVPRMPP